MDKKKELQISEALSGLSYREFLDVTNRIEESYHITKKELTSEEISSVIKSVR